MLIYRLKQQAQQVSMLDTAMTAVQARVDIARVQVVAQLSPCCGSIAGAGGSSIDAGGGAEAELSEACGTGGCGVSAATEASVYTSACRSHDAPPSTTRTHLSSSRAVDELAGARATPAPHEEARSILKPFSTKQTPSNSKCSEEEGRQGGGGAHSGPSVSAARLSNRPTARHQCQVPAARDIVLPGKLGVCAEGAGIGITRTITTSSRRVGERGDGGWYCRQSCSKSVYIQQRGEGGGEMEEDLWQLLSACDDAERLLDARESRQLQLIDDGHCHTHTHTPLSRYACVACAPLTKDNMTPPTTRKEKKVKGDEQDECRKGGGGVTDKDKMRTKSRQALDDCQGGGGECHALGGWMPSRCGGIANALRAASINNYNANTLTRASLGGKKGNGGVVGKGDRVAHVHVHVDREGHVGARPQALKSLEKRLSLVSKTLSSMQKQQRVTSVKVHAPPHAHSPQRSRYLIALSVCRR
jgi:hypothetical protein